MLGRGRGQSAGITYVQNQTAAKAKAAAAAGDFEEAKRLSDSLSATQYGRDLQRNVRSNIEKAELEAPWVGGFLGEEAFRIGNFRVAWWHVAAATVVGATGMIALTILVTRKRKT